MRPPRRPCSECRNRSWEDHAVLGRGREEGAYRAAARHSFLLIDGGGPRQGAPASEHSFFRSTADVTEATRDGAPAGGTFGSIEEQKLRRLVKNVGARMEEDIEEIRRNIEGEMTDVS